MPLSSANVTGENRHDRENLDLSNRLQEAFARKLVEQGRYASLSAVLQHGLELLRARREADEADTEALRALIEKRRRGQHRHKQTEQMIAAVRKKKR